MRSILTVVVLALAAVAAAEIPAYESTSTVPKGLALFLQARSAEVQGDVRTALQLYDDALEAAPEVQEIRIAYAALLQGVGMVGEAAELLRGRSELGWYGTRTLGLVLGQLSTREEELMPEARAALEAALAERPDDLQVQMALVQILERTGEFEAAEAIVRRLRRQRPGSGQLQLVHGSLLHRMGRHGDAADIFTMCADSEPFAGVCRERLVESLVAANRLEEAGRRLLEAAAPGDEQALLRAAALLSEGGDPERAIEVVRRVLAADPRSRPARTLEAMLLTSLGRMEEAAVRLRKLHRDEKADLQVALALAWAEGRLGREEEARRVLEDAWRRVADEPGSEDALRTAVTAARLELAAQHATRAREWLQRVDAAAGGAEVVSLLAETYRRDELWREGVAAMLRLQPHLGEGARQQARAAEAEFRLRQGDDAGAKALIEPLLRAAEPAHVGAALEVLQRLERWQEVATAAAAAGERFPQVSAFAFAEGAALERLGRQEEAEAVFSALLEDEPNHAPAANYLGYMWADEGVNLESALELIERAVALDPNNDAYLDSLGWVHFRLGNFDEAETWLRRAVQLGGSDGTVLAHLGEVLVALDRSGEARTVLQRALEVGVEEPERVRELLEKLSGSP